MERIWINKIKYSQHKQIHDFLFCGGVVKEGKSPDFTKKTKLVRKVGGKEKKRMT